MVRDGAGLTRLLARLGCRGDLIVVSNRAPWVHTHTPAGIVAAQPAGGLVTALEALLAAQDGCWIAHGSGDADRAASDAHGHALASQTPAAYRLRRLWLSQDEVDGHYHGLANDGLWPLCHEAGVAPLFRSADWRRYRAVNQRFADAVVAEARSERPVVLVQDYHLALVPRMVRARLPQAVVIAFWHIPFPAPARWAAFPWRAEMMAGLLESDVVGLQTGADLAHFEAARAACADHGRACAGAYPVSIAWPQTVAETAPAQAATRAAARQLIEDRFKVTAGVRVLLGVDRLDYTKGIPERLQAFERLLERRPALRGGVTLLQVTAPGRPGPAYRRLEQQVRRLAARINARFGDADWTPVALHLDGADAATVSACYRACDACLVTSLHDGMNLVAKEFVAARADLRGALVLSRHAGAAAELRHALAVDPRDLDALADALEAALAMAPHEQAARMAAMRSTVRRHTVFGWAARLLEDGMRAAEVHALARFDGAGEPSAVLEAAA
jgi:trehalose 6-phosphate synthase